MAKLKLFAVRDSKIEAFVSPHFLQHTGQAIRGFEEVVNNPESALCRHPGDFTLFELGELDQETGQLIPSDHIKNLGDALSFKRSPAEQATLPFVVDKTQGRESLKEAR